MNLILIEPHEASGTGSVSLGGFRAAHLRHVLGVVPGSTVRVGIVDGPRGVGTITAVTETDISLHCAWDASIPERPVVDLLLALPRPKVMKRLFAQLAALGVGRIMLTNAARVERNYFDTHVLGPESYRPLLIEGLQQARDTRLPVVTVHQQLKVFLEDELGPLSDALRVYADPGADKEIPAVLAARAGRRVLVAVGPEGGWTEYERRLLETHSFSKVTMGQRTLRSDTACIVLLAMVHAGLRAASTRSTIL